MKEQLSLYQNGKKDINQLEESLSKKTKEIYDLTV